MNASARATGRTRDAETARELVSAIPDPEIPVLTLGDLGVIRDIDLDANGIKVGVTPTYSACPATEVIEAAVRDTLLRNGYANVEIERVMSPPWTTDWISAEGRRKLRDYGIAPPPEASTSKKAVLSGDLAVACPRCESTSTTRVSEYGSTPVQGVVQVR